MENRDWVIKVAWMHENPLAAQFFSSPKEFTVKKK